MNLRAFAPAFAFCAAALLAGCNASTSPVAVAPSGPSPANKPAVDVLRLPEGTGCATAISRYRAIMDNDHATGHVNQSVFATIQGEIAEAESACAAGQDARAQALVHASKARHGYPG